MQKVDRGPFLVLLLDAAVRLEALVEDDRTPLSAARIAFSVGLAPKSGIGIGDDLVQAIVFFGNPKKYQDVSWNIIALMARFQEESAWASYQRHYARHAA